jgi:glycosyltransferase involved in cell wall biosynthesis
MAMLEAQAAGVPVVSVADRGVPDVVIDGRTGLLAPRLNAASLADLARTLLLDSVKRTAMGRAAMQHVAAERSIQSASRALDSMLQQVRASARAI